MNPRLNVGYDIWQIRDGVIMHYFLSQCHADALLVESRLEWALDTQECIVCCQFVTHTRTQCCHQVLCYKCLLKWDQKSDDCPFCRQ